MSHLARAPDQDLAETARAFHEALAAVPQYALLRIDIHPSLSQRACWFCGCLPPRPQTERDLERRYIKAMRNEIAAAGRALNGSGQTASVVFGAGAPFGFGPDAVAFALDAVEAEIGLTNMARLSVELLAEDVRAADIAALAGLGVGAVTVFGAETHPSGLSEEAAFERLESAIGVLRAAEIDDVGIAFFVDLPSRSPTALGEAADRILCLGPDRIHAFAFGDRVRLDPAFRSVPTPPQRLGRLTPRIIASGYSLAGPGVFVRPERRLEVAAALEARLTASTLGFGAGALSHLRGRDFRNLRKTDAYLAAAEHAGSPVELSALSHA